MVDGIRCYQKGRVMKPRIYLSLWKLWGCIGWFSGNDFKLFRFETSIFEPELEYLFMVSLTVLKFSIEFGINT